MKRWIGVALALVAIVWSATAAVSRVSREAMAVLERHNTPDAAICTGDSAAIIALCCLGLAERAVSLETLLSKCGQTAQVINQFTEASLNKKLKKGKVLQIQFYS